MALKANSTNDNIIQLEGDVIIVGAGLAGIFTALKLAPRPVTLISPTPLGQGASSTWAQGGIAAALGEGDHPDNHVVDTILAGGGLVDEHIAKLVTYEASARIHDLLSYGVPFDKDLAGKLKLSREAAHSHGRVVRVKGDMAGKAIMSAMIAEVRKTPSIHLLEGYCVQGFLKTHERLSGIHFSKTNALHRSQTFSAFADKIVLATGGIGGLYAVTTNPMSSRGEGLGMAALAGAAITDAEFVQFHPTAIDIHQDPAPLATEALRGKGATLVNAAGKRFMQDLHADAELAPRDIVAKAVHNERLSGRGAYLDCRDAIGEQFAEKFPAVYQKCAMAGINPETDIIPIAPAAHYHMGGVLTDENGRTTIDGLWACGEVASTGMHGANRLASNSLLEAVVYAARIADDINNIGPYNKLAPASAQHHALQNQVKNEAPQDFDAAMQDLRALISDHVGVIRSKTGLEMAQSKLENFYAYVDGPSVFLHPLRNACLAARFIITAALMREESRGAHNRSDFPNTDPQHQVRKSLRLENNDIVPFYEPEHLLLRTASTTN